MKSKRKVKVTADSIVLGISGKAVLVLGLILALKNEPSWIPIISIALAAMGLFLTVWGFVLSNKRRAVGEGTLTAVLVIMGLLTLACGIIGYFEVIGVLIPGIAAAVVGVASDIVLAIIGKEAKKKKTEQE